MQYSISTEGELLYIQWNKKAPSVERDMHQMGGAWQDFNCYRFPLDEVNAKKVLRYAKQNGSLSLSPGAKETIKDMIETARRAERLTRGDADAEISRPRSRPAEASMPRNTLSRLCGCEDSQKEKERLGWKPKQDSPGVYEAFSF